MNSQRTRRTSSCFVGAGRRGPVNSATSGPEDRKAQDRFRRPGREIYCAPRRGRSLRTSLRSGGTNFSPVSLARTTRDRNSTTHSRPNFSSHVPPELLPAVPSLQDQAVRLIQAARVVAHIQRVVVVPPDHPDPVALSFLQDSDASFINQLTGLHAARRGPRLRRLRFPGDLPDPHLGARAPAGALRL
jgi:hypothetical protein